MSTTHDTDDRHYSSNTFYQPYSEVEGGQTMFPLHPLRLAPTGYVPISNEASLGQYQQSSGSKRNHEHQYLSSSAHQEDAGLQKKRKLDLVKCERCRIDKQKVAHTSQSDTVFVILSDSIYSVLQRIESGLPSVNDAS